MLNNRTTFMERLNDRVAAIEALLQKLEPVEGLLERLTMLEENIYTTKNMFTFMEACAYLGVSESLLYKLTSTKEIPHYKPRGKMVYFDKAELDVWLKQNNVPTLGNVIGNDGYGMGNDETNNAEAEQKNKRVPYFKRVRYAKRNKQQ